MCGLFLFKRLPPHSHSSAGRQGLFFPPPCGEVGVGWEEANLVMICLHWEGAAGNNPEERQRKGW